MQLRSKILAIVYSLFSIAASSGLAQDQSVGVKLTEDLVYGHKDGLALTLDVVQPEQNRNGKGIILVSSGSWISRKSDIPEQNQRGALRSQEIIKGGYTLFVVRHGSSPRYFIPEMVRDMNRSVRYVRSIAQRFEVDPDHLGITGFSSGGHLSLMTALTADDGIPDSKDPLEQVSSKVQCVMAWFPPTDFLNWGQTDSYKADNPRLAALYKRVLGDVTDLESQLKAISPTCLVKKDSPPLLLIHGDADKTVPLQQSELMKAKYEESSLPVKLIVQPDGGHGAWPNSREHFVTVREWFDQHLK